MDEPLNPFPELPLKKTTAGPGSRPESKNLSPPNSCSKLRYCLLSNLMPSHSNWFSPLRCSQGEISFGLVRLQALNFIVLMFVVFISSPIRDRKILNEKALAFFDRFLALSSIQYRLPSSYFYSPSSTSCLRSPTLSPLPSTPFSPLHLPSQSNSIYSIFLPALPLPHSSHRGNHIMSWHSPPNAPPVDLIQQWGL